MAEFPPRLKPTRRWIQFSLRTMLVLTLACGVWLGRFVEQARRQKHVIEAVLASRGRVIYQHELKPGFDPHAWFERNPYFLDINASPEPRCLCPLFGEELFVKAVGVSLDRPFGQPGGRLLKDCPYLEELVFTCNDRDACANLEGLTRLKRIEIIGWPECVNLVPLKSSRGLEAIEFTLGADESHTEHFAAFPRLRDVSINSIKLSQRVFRNVSCLTHLERLVMHGDEITDAMAEELLALKHLKELTLSGTMTDDVAARFRDLPRLERLELHSSELTGSVLRRLNKNLTYLSVSCADSTTIRKHRFHGVDLEFLQELKKLEELHLDVWLSRDDALLALRKLTQLKELVLHIGGLETQQLAELRRALPRCAVIDLE